MRSGYMPMEPNGSGHAAQDLRDALLSFAAYWIPFPRLTASGPSETSLDLDLDLAAHGRHPSSPAPAPDFVAARTHGGHSGGMPLAGGRAGHLRGSSRSR